MVPQHFERDTPTRSHRTACLIHLLENTVRAVFLVYDRMYLLRIARAAAFRVDLSKVDSLEVLVVGVTVVVDVDVVSASGCCSIGCIFAREEEMKL
jgi:hypothetical protein